jgi:prepilin-type N-terminal cleavage/methylation domain-containing protein
MSPTRNGFTLPEVLPAILILVICLLAGFRFLHLSLRAEERSEDFSLARSAFKEVWKSWREGQGRAAITVLKDGGRWEVYEFPDLSWLPAGGMKAVGDSPEILWKRSLRTGGDRGLQLWDVEKQTAKAPDWIWWGAFMEWDDQDEKPN